LAAIFAGLELAGLLNLVRFEGKSPGDTPAHVRPWPQNGTS
jgi:hypothetical protein